MDVSNLSGRIVAVTGAASGIGRATALAFAERGADLALCDIDEDGLQETGKRASEMNRSAHLRRVDVANSEDVERWPDHRDRDFWSTNHPRLSTSKASQERRGKEHGCTVLDATVT